MIGDLNQGTFKNKSFLTKTEIKRVVRFLESYKGYVGFGDYKVMLSLDSLKDGDKAKVTVDIYEKELKIQLAESFKKETDDKKANILIHELTHGRFSAFQDIVDELTKYEEENLINDLTKGICGKDEVQY